MVIAVTAYKASDGSIHDTELAAAKQDARIQLKALKIFNEGTISEILANVHKVMEALEPVAAETPRDAVDMLVAAQEEAR